MSFEPVRRYAASVKSDKERAVMEENTRLLHGLFEDLHPHITAGATGKQIQDFCATFFARMGLQPLLRGYRNYPADICISVNEVAAHGLPDDRPFQHGDVVSIDIAARRGHICADAAWTWIVPPAPDAALRLVAAAWQACTAGIVAGGSSRHISVMGRAIQAKAASLGHAVLPRFGGHGIGRHLHEAPFFAFVDAAQGTDKLSDGWVVNVEPVICQSAATANLGADGWSWQCPSSQYTAQFELSLALLKDGGFRVLNFADQHILQSSMPPFY